jgi:predicted nucleic acid-binding protein
VVTHLDTNVLVYAADGTSPFHHPSKHLRDSGLRGEVSLCVFPQIFSEFFAVITDSRRVSNPRTREEAATEIEKYLKAAYLLKLYPGPDVMDIMLDLLRRYQVKRQEVFDLQLVATMLSNNIKRIYTFNREHFDRFAEIDALDP